MLSYFTVCLWMVPFLFILSLSANDNTLPIINEGKLTTFLDFMINIIISGLDIFCLQNILSSETW